MASHVCSDCNKSYSTKAGLTKHKCPNKNTLVEQPTNTENRTAISLFSGCGGDTLGLERAGFKVVAFSELKKTFAETHLLNFPDSKTILDSKGKTSDITKIEDTQFQLYTDKVDLIFAGFPCQGFSHAGKKQQDDPRNQMYLQFVRATKLIKPRFIIGENVQGLERMKSGPDPQDPMMIERIRAAFAQIGYSIAYKVHEATDFGVPQKRKRVLIIGWDTSRVTNFNAATFWEQVAVNGRANKATTMRSFVTNSMEGAYLIPPQSVPEGFSTYALPVVQNAEPSGTVHPYVKLKADTNLLSCTKRDSPIHSEIINVDAPSKTIICTYGHQPRLLVGLKKPDGTAYARTLLPDELKQIQGFPSDYKLSGSVSERVIQVGNAVPPPMIDSVAKALKNYFD
jgi:DNA (cytosine-5)-methyltransferase 1